MPMTVPQPKKTQLLVVEDDRDFRATLVQALQKAEYRVDASPASAPAWSWLQRQVPDLILLDLMLPDWSGLELCRRIRRDPRLEQTPILMLTALGSEKERIAGFLHGSDDYMVKPVVFAELLWRIRAILRRATGKGPACLQLRELEIYPDSTRVCVEGQMLELSRSEYALLLELAEAKGHICSRDSLLDRVWRGKEEVNERVVDSTIKRLRQGLGKAGDLVHTHRGMGYSLREPGVQ